MRFFLLLLMLLLGLAGGWLLRDRMPEPADTASDAAKRDAHRSERTAQKAPLQELLEAGKFHHVVDMVGGDTGQLTALANSASREDGLALLRTANEMRGGDFEITMAMAGLQAEDGNFDAAAERLLRAAMLVSSEAQEARLVSQLNRVTEVYARELIAAEDFERLDSHYESIALALPEQAEYYLKLGQLRLRLGDFERAMLPLSHIENDRQWGERARELMAKAEAGEVQSESAGQEIALRRQGSQFVVEATIDHNRRADLLIDTGAAVTILDAGFLGQLGYSLQDQRQEYFATANGVVEAPVVSIGHLALGDSGIRELPVGALPLELPDGIDGLLGMNFLRHYQFRIDQSRDLLHLDADHRQEP